MDEDGVARRIERGEARPHRVAALRATADAATSATAEVPAKAADPAEAAATVAVILVAERIYRRALMQTGGKLTYKDAWNAEL